MTVHKQQSPIAPTKPNKRVRFFGIHPQMTILANILHHVSFSAYINKQMDRYQTAGVVQQTHPCNRLTRMTKKNGHLMVSSVAFAGAWSLGLCHFSIGGQFSVDYLPRLRPGGSLWQSWNIFAVLSVFFWGMHFWSQSWSKGIRNSE